MEVIVPLEHGCYYHIYNRGVNGASLFYNDDNYSYFLKLYAQHVDPIADTYAWCLMNNHFHLLVRIKDVDEVGVNTPDRVSNPVRGGATIKPPHQYFSNMFNAYTQAVNRQQGRTGSLFERPFHRKQIGESDYFRQLVAYIHNNPVKHGFVDDCSDYPWTSYHTILSDKPTRLRRNDIIEWFDTLDNFTTFHRLVRNYEHVEDYMFD
jgi:REP element-mobilizing transposase RayT